MAGGEAGALVRNHDWPATQLGPIEQWSQALRTAVDLTLSAPVAALLLWGPSHIQIYNDLWKVLHSGRHPAALGQRTHECFAELADAPDGVYQRVWRGEGVFLEDNLLPAMRTGLIEDAWWNAIYMPVRGESATVEGILCILVETTGKVLAERARVQSEAMLQERARVEGALRESEQRFRLLVENVREYALVQTDFEGIVTSWNPGAARLFGYDSAEIVGKPFALLLPEQDRREGIIAPEMASLSRGERNLDAHAVQRKDGSQFWAEWITEPVLDDNGELRGTAKVMRDETERQRAEGALRGSLAEKESLLSEVHHRVKNNLQVITSLLSLQSRGLNDPNATRLFHETRNRVQSIASIHESLYRSSAFARINLLDYTQRVVHGLVRFYNAQTRVKVTIEGEGASLELERAAPFGLLLNELASNAFRHGFPEPDSGSLIVTVQGDYETVLLQVRDTGRGLPAGFREEEATSLGLRLVRMLVTQLNARIEFHSGAGTSVSVRIPVGKGPGNHG
jgi:PAS domain S-box-containing protein